MKNSKQHHAWRVPVLMLIAMGLIAPEIVAQETSGHRPRRSASDGPSAQDKQIIFNPGGAAARFPFAFRTIDGSGNNEANPSWGQKDAPLLRVLGSYYGDGVDSANGDTLLSARAVSNICADQLEFVDNPQGVSSMLWQWGQFVDHDIDLVPVADPIEPLPIPVPTGDPEFDPLSTGTMEIDFERSYGEHINGVREQLNEITAFIDGSNVYGSDEVRAAALRTMDGTGRLKTSANNLLPFNVDGLPNAMSESEFFFLAGDFRANEQIALSAMHTLWVREHNFWAGVINMFFRFLPGDTKYEWARAIVVGEMQAITYDAFLPALLGPGAIPAYTGYKSDVNPGIANSFATAAYRFGHTMLPPELLRLDRQLNTIPEGNLDLKDAFFNPDNLTSIGVEPYLRGLAKQPAQKIDNKIVDGVRNFLFGEPGQGGFDLAALNIQRGRDHGLPSLNEARVALGLAPATSFADIHPSADVQQKLIDTYGTVDNVELWIGGLAEEPVAGSMLGMTFHTILVEQFTALRDGDRFWYEAYLPPFLVRMVKAQTLDRIIRRNTGIGREVSGNVFYVQ